MLLSLVYVSRATSRLSRSDLLALRDQSNEANERAAITGLLLHREGRFLQDLEGAEERVLDLYARIRRDPRHSDVTLVWTQPVVDRRFDRWRMALAQLRGDPVELGAEGDQMGAVLPEATLMCELLDLVDPQR